MGVMTQLNNERIVIMELSKDAKELLDKFLNIGQKYSGKTGS
jgi:hypothetical protein